ncbi:PREDICTED: uncharacterized protein LOC108609913 [Drosophila arizonae]|uniref:Uncharacterized protein LOC108609913 n=1 Tax=Drosophila arizonae TaxID=7263 RepID=A0ABM1NQE5_DROAR|nr:PREDICTED: uncharacterized protein LOC108609913 [Drosophila arizonae]
MNIKWQTFPKLFVVLPILHYALSMFMHAESEENKRKKELAEKANSKAPIVIKL